MGSKTWTTKEWREARDGFLEGKVCEWCGHANKDVIAVRVWKNGKRINETKQVTLHLSPHHRKKTRLGLVPYKRIARQMFKEFKKENPEGYDALYSEAVAGLPYGNNRDILKRMQYLFSIRNRERIQVRYQEWKQLQERAYVELTPKKAIVLCNRCHKAREEGNVLCKRCGTYYHKPKYQLCYSCHREVHG